MKSKAVAIFLSFFFGGAGAHNYYLGYKKNGIIQSAGCVSSIVAETFQAYSPFSALLLLLLRLFGIIISIWALAEFISLCTGKMKPAEGEFKSKPTRKSTADDFIKLADLRNRGLITEDEFRTKRNKLLDRL